MHIAIFTSPTVQKGTFVSEAIATADTIIAADRGALAALRQNIIPEIVIGDFDSIDQKTLNILQTKNITTIKAPRGKDETDTQLAITHAIKQGATSISLIGGTSVDRIDHTIANISLTYHPTIPIYLINGPSKSWIASASNKIKINGKKNDLLSLLPMTQQVTGIKTEGSYYPLHNEPLYFAKPRGISNVFIAEIASVSFQEGMLLLIHIRPEELPN